MAKPYILIVEDEKDQALNIQEILDDAFGETHDTLIAHNGYDALSLVGEFQGEIELVLLDINMPKMSGTTFYDELEKRYFLSMPPVVVLTAQVFVDQMINVMAGRDFYDYMTKPYEASSLVRVTQSALNSFGQFIPRSFSKDFLVRELIYKRNMILMNWYSSAKHRSGLTYEDVFKQLIPCHRVTLRESECKTLLATLSDDTNESPLERWTPKVVCIEDDPEYRQNLLEIFEDVDVDVVAFDSLSEAETYLETEAVDIVLLDLCLEGSQISEVVKWISSHDAPYQEVIVHSGCEDLGEIKKSLQSGVDKFLQKPVKAPVLINSVMHSFDRLYTLRAASALVDKFQAMSAPFGESS